MKELYFFDETFYWGRSDGTTYTITAHLTRVEKE